MSVFYQLLAVLRAADLWFSPRKYRTPPGICLEQEIDDMVMMGDDTRIFHTAETDPGELDAYCTDDDPSLDVRGHTVLCPPARQRAVPEYM